MLRIMAYLFIPIKLIDTRICISYFGPLLLSIILWRLRWNLRCRINFFNSLTINLEMLSLCWNNESSYTDVSWGSHNLFSALSNRKQLFETFEFITFAINHDYSELMDPSCPNMRGMLRSHILAIVYFT